MVFRYRQLLAALVNDASALEGNLLSCTEVKDLLNRDNAFGGCYLSNQRQMLNISNAADRLPELVRSARFRLDKSNSFRLHMLAVKEEVREWGHFRGEGEEHSLTSNLVSGWIG